MLILIHGLGQTPASWEKTISQPALSQEAILCVDLIQLLKDKPVVYDNLYQAFSEYCLAMDEPIHLCGLSLGGILALQFAIAHPDKVKSLVLIGIQFVMPERLLKLQNIMFRFMPGHLFSKMGFQKKDFIQLSKSMLKLNFEQNLGKLACPVLVLCGEKDKVNKTAAVELERRIPDATLRFVEHAGHEVNVDAPEQLGVILSDFIRSVRN